MTTTDTQEPSPPSPLPEKRNDAILAGERGLHLISDQIGLISTNHSPAGVTTTINNNNADPTSDRDPTNMLMTESRAGVIDKGTLQGADFSLVTCSEDDDHTPATTIIVQTNSQTTNTNNLITNEGDEGINNNKRRDESTVLDLSAASSTTNSSSTHSSTTTSPPRVMIPHPSRSSNGPYLGDVLMAGEEEAVLNMAAALVSISTCSPPESTAPCEQPPQQEPEEPCEPGKIKAYAKLHGPDWSFYLKKPSLTMGRAPSQSRQFTAGDSCPVDFYLSSADSLSRTHLRIDYNPDRQRWEMSCLGKSGVKVDKRRFEAFCPPIPLYADSTITVANATFHFSLPLNGASREASPFERMMRKRKSVDDGAEDAENRHNNNGNNDATTTASNSPNEDDDDAVDNYNDYEDTASLVGVGEYSKPPQSYANLIAEAINSTPNKRMTLSCIYQFLADKYPYFRHTKNGWQNSVRHNLSLNKAFKKVPRGLDEPGKGMLWIIDPDFKHLVDGSIGRRASVRSRTPDLHGPQQRPPLTFIHHHQSMFQTANQNPPNYHLYNHNSNQQTHFNQQQQQQYMLYQQQQQARSHPPILPAPDTTHLRPIATIAAAISASATAASTAASTPVEK